MDNLKGGLRMINIYNFEKALKLNWFKLMHSGIFCFPKYIEVLINSAPYMVNGLHIQLH